MLVLVVIGTLGMVLWRTRATLPGEDVVSSAMSARGRMFGDVSTATFIGGAAALVAGTIVVLTAPRGSNQVALGARGAGLEVSGRW